MINQGEITLDVPEDLNEDFLKLENLSKKYENIQIKL